MRAWLATLVVVFTLACDPRDTRLGFVSLPIRPDAGVSLRGAAPVGPLGLDRCQAAVYPNLPLVVCQGASSPPEFQCVVAVRPDGGVAVLRQLPLSGTRTVQRLHGVTAGRLVAEVVDSAAGPRVLESFPYPSPGSATTLASAGSAIRWSGTAVDAASVDVVACAAGRCSLDELPLDGGSAVELATDTRSAATTVIERNASGVRAWADDAGVVSWTPEQGLRRTDAVGVSRAALATDGSVFFLEGTTLVRVNPAGVRAELAQGLDGPHALFLIGGFAVVVERRAVRAFPQVGGAPLALYSLPASDTGTLANARLVDGRLVFDQRCGMLGPTALSGRVELDPTLGQARWLNEDPAWPYLPGAPGGASRVAPVLRDVLVVDGLLLGVVE
ncbi:MAG: hypothetical protein SFW67_32875 [Myxococcaceae bacterium]|nr:hypothetical protein [Myxococcaceae bacterium]